MSAKSDSMHRPCIIKGWVVNKTQERIIRNVIGGVGWRSTTVQLLITAEPLS